MFATSALLTPIDSFALLINQKANFTLSNLLTTIVAHVINLIDTFCVWKSGLTRAHFRYLHL